VLLTALITPPMVHFLSSLSLSLSLSLSFSLFLSLIHHNLSLFHVGTFIASCADEGDIFLWNAETGQLVRKLEGHKHPVSWIAFSPVKGDNRLASCADDFTVRIWDYTNGNTVLTLKGHESAVKSVNFSTNGKFLVSGSRDRSIRVWDSRNGNCLHTFLGHKDWLNSVSFSPDSKNIISGSWDYTMKVWSLRKDAEVAALLGHEGALCQARYFPSGKHIISASFDGGMKIWDAESMTEITSVRLHFRSIPFHSLCALTTGPFSYLDTNNESTGWPFLPTANSSPPSQTMLPSKYGIPWLRLNSILSSDTAAPLEVFDSLPRQNKSHPRPMTAQ